MATFDGIMKDFTKIQDKLKKLVSSKTKAILHRAQVITKLEKDNVTDNIEISNANNAIEKIGEITGKS